MQNRSSWLKEIGEKTKNARNCYLLCVKFIYSKTHQSGITESSKSHTYAVKVSKFLDGFVMPSFLPKYRSKIVKISALPQQSRNPGNFLFEFWKDAFIDPF